VLHQGYFFIQDLGSTNGVRFEGSRVDTRRIDEGDRFEICEHQLTFTYRDLGAA
jgi:pSer/pThr/pTyr-binding forkhead associated (FHA) protein